MSRQSRPLFQLSCLAPSAVAFGRGVDFNDAQITVASARIKGIAFRPAAAGEPYECTTHGTATCEAGAAIAKGAPLTMDAVGRAVPASGLAVAAGAAAVTSTAANGAILSGGDLPQYVIGHAMEAATAAGQFIEVLLCR